MGGSRGRWRGRGNGQAVTLFVRQRVHDRPDEPVSAARQRLDELRGLGRVAEGIAQSPHGRVQAMLEVDERICRPQPIPERLASDELARLLEQRLEDLDRLVGNFETARPLAELSRADVELKDTEAYASRRRSLIVHRGLMETAPCRPSHTAGQSCAR
jgi:hypothetical protein